MRIVDTHVHMIDDRVDAEDILRSMDANGIDRKRPAASAANSRWVS